MLGFGARLIQPDGPVEHCFNVSDTEEVHGVEGILQVIIRIVVQYLSLTRFAIAGLQRSCPDS